MIRVAEIQTKLQNFYWLHRLVILRTVAITPVVILVFFMVSYITPRAMHFSYASGHACAVDPLLLPSNVTPKTSDPFTVQYRHSIRLGTLKLFAGSICVVPGSAPKQAIAYDISRHFSALALTNQKVTVKTASYTHAAPSTYKQPIALSSELQFQLDQPDTTFSYAISANNHISTCSLQTLSLRCPIKPLDLAYGQKYSVKLVRLFQGQTVQANVTQAHFETISATTIPQASVANGATVYDKPVQFTFQADKSLVSLGKVTLAVKKDDGSEQLLPSSQSFSGSLIALHLTQPLPRKSMLHLRIESLQAQDGSGLAAPYDISFAVSGGPQVTANTLPKYDVTAGSAITLTFDQPLDPNQSLGPLVSLQANGSAVPITTTISNNRVIIGAKAAYPVCAHLTLNVAAGLVSNYGVASDAPSSYSSRAQCHTTFSIGTSVQGRSITAYRIGSGSTQIFFIGTMHGTENNSGVLLDKWLNELEANVDNIPAGHSIVIIPRINPDGVAASKRTNANGVDINRNFPSDSWKSVVTEPDGTIGPAGGASSLSEPESQAIAAYVQAQQPKLTIDYHSHAGIVQGNGAGAANLLAAQYASKSGYSVISSSATSSVFDYDTTGSFEDWTNEKLGLQEFIVELTSSTNDEFTKNRSAMWNILGAV